MAKKEKDIEDLEGVGPSTAEKLREAGYTTILSIAASSPKEMVNLAGVTDTTAIKMIKDARDSMGMGFQTASDLEKKRSKSTKITTGCNSFDEILAGGFETGAITELFGSYGSGKTQIAELMCVRTLLADKSARAVYIDTENTFRPGRIRQFAEGAGIDPEDAVKRIMVARAFNSDHQILLAEKVEEIIKGGENVKLIVVDSLTAHFRAEFVGRGTLADRQQKLNRHMHTLAKIADLHNACVIVTNQVMARPDVFFGDPTEAIGGHIVGHNSTYRIYLRRGKKNTRVAKLIDAPDLADAECAYNIGEKGIQEV